MKKLPLVCAFAALLAGCSRTDNEPGPGGVTVSEAKALDDAAAMLENRNAAANTQPETPQKGAEKDRP